MNDKIENVKETLRKVYFETFIAKKLVVSSISKEQVEKIEDPIHTPMTVSTWDGDSLVIESDDGNESSYGSETWFYQIGDGRMYLTDEHGRDTFDGLLSEKIFGENYYPANNIGKSCTLRRFRFELAAHLAGWKLATTEYVDQLDESGF